MFNLCRQTSVEILWAGRGRSGAQGRREHDTRWTTLIGCSVVGVALESCRLQAIMVLFGFLTHTHTHTHTHHTN